MRTPPPIKHPKNKALKSVPPAWIEKPKNPNDFYLDPPKLQPPQPVVCHFTKKPADFNTASKSWKGIEASQNAQKLKKCCIINADSQRSFDHCRTKKRSLIKRNRLN